MRKTVGTRRGTPGLRAGMAGSALALSALLAGTGVATAEPAPESPDSAEATENSTEGADAADDTESTDTEGDEADPDATDDDLADAEVPAIPLDSELAAAVRMLKESGADQMALEAAESIISALGQLSVTDLTGALSGLLGSSGGDPAEPGLEPEFGEPEFGEPADPLAPTPVDEELELTVETDETGTDGGASTESTTPSTTPSTGTTTPGATPRSGTESTTSPASPTSPAAPTTPDPLDLLALTGIQTLTPSIAPMCTDPSADNPLGLVTGGAGAIAGPWPGEALTESGLAEIIDSIGIVDLDSVAEASQVVDEDEVVYAFVPGSPTSGGAGNMQVAWFNLNTFKGGFADLKPAGAADHQVLRALAEVPGLRGLRLAPVQTEQGTVLSAVFGTSQNGSKTCYFLPSVGVVEA